MFIDFAALAVCPSLSHRKAFFGIVIIVIKAFISFSLGQLQKKVVYLSLAHLIY